MAIYITSQSYFNCSEAYYKEFPSIYTAYNTIYLLFLISLLANFNDKGFYCIAILIKS
jgi:hypothetical protein